jgi:hypothetical protein
MLSHYILQCWEKGIPLCKELAELYERRLFDYAKLSEILQTQAKFFDNILTQLRPEPEYFRVGFYGLSFPLFVRVRYIFMFCKTGNIMFEILPTIGTFFLFLGSVSPLSLVGAVSRIPNDFIMTHRISCLCTVAWSTSGLVRSLSDCRQSSPQHRSL